MISKEQICHDLALLYANKESDKEMDTPDDVAEFAIYEKMLILYDKAYNGLINNYENILKDSNLW